MKTPTPKPTDATHVSGGRFFRVTKIQGSRVWACKWIKSTNRWSRPQEYINFNVAGGDA